MQTFTWKPAYAIGDPKIDAQHERLFDLANELMRADDEAALTVAAMQLCQYVRLHFQHEEEVMHRLAYPDLQRHRDLHEGLVERLNALSLDIASGHWHGEGLGEFMMDWLLGHILNEDARLAEFLGAPAVPGAT